MEPGSSFRIFLADLEGTLIRCQWYAQQTPIPVAVRKRGKTLYRRLAEIPSAMVTGAAPGLWKVAVRPDPRGGRFDLQVLAVDLVTQNPAAPRGEPELLPGPGGGVRAAGQAGVLLRCHHLGGP